MKFLEKEFPKRYKAYQCLPRADSGSENWLQTDTRNMDSGDSTQIYKFQNIIEP